MAASPLLARRLGRAIVLGRRWILILMLLALHAGLISQPGGDFQRIWLLVHFGLFLLWQPFFAADTELEFFSVAMLAAITLSILYFLAGWMIVMWILVLLGILGGKVFTVRGARRAGLAYLAAFSYLVAMLLVWAVPTLLLPEQSIPMPIGTFAGGFLPFLLLVVLLLPVSNEEPGQVFDFFYAVLVFQLVMVLVLGSIAVMRYTDDAYFPSVVITMCGFGVALFVLAVLWSPRRGFGGLRTLFSRYLLSVGMPFEMWMRRVAELAETEVDSRRFLEQVLAEIGQFPWVRGGRWRSADGEGDFGLRDGYATKFNHQGLELTFYTGVRLSPALFLHMRLLAQVVGEFYEGKRRESALRQHAYLQAVHETGARLTHDIKNLLQSLYALTSAAPEENAASHQELLHRQLPQLTRRLHATIEKLRSPEIPTADIPVDAQLWWSEVQKRHAQTGISFEGRVDEGASVPASFFDGLVENFLDNARAKRARDEKLAITLAFTADAQGADLRVRDTGAAVPPTILRRLFREPLENAKGEGLGIGLFQAARQARTLGYRLELLRNVDGDVCFRVASEAAPAAAASPAAGS